MGRFALRLAAACLLLLAGFAAAVFAAGPAFGLAAATTTGSAPTTTGSAPTTSATVTSPARAVIVFSGHGYGHGLGLSQWGAYGYAKHGLAYDRILAHYYPGTSLGPDKPRTLRVLLTTAKQATVGSTGPWSVSDAAGRRAQLAPGSLVLGGTPALPEQPQFQPPFTFTAASPLSLGGVTYRGKLVVSGNGKAVQVVDVVGLEQYLRGVVPAEMPANWPAAAVQAQAVAARSYALANLTKGRPYDVYGDTRSQAYGGVPVETAATDAAVTATRGQVVLYGGKVADTLFFSTSGGRTASALESTGVAVPYLVGVADPYDTLSPYHDWGPVLLDARKVAQTMQLGSPIADVQVVPWPSGRVRSLIVVSADESQVAVTGNEARVDLGLRSTWFTPAFLELSPAAKTMTYGGAVSLAGVAHGASSVTLESKSVAQPVWAPAGAVPLGPDDSFSTVVHPQASTQYRLAWGDVRAGLAKIAVAPRIDATVSAGSVGGSLRPALAGTEVDLQLLSGTTWSSVSTTTSGAAGDWSFSGPLAVGTYRIRSAPAHGLAAGLSATLLVQ